MVTRYFGGTKLGAGGLIRAYSGAVAQAIASTGIVEGRLQQEVFVQLDYPNWGRMENFIANEQVAVKIPSSPTKLLLLVWSMKIK